MKHTTHQGELDVWNIWPCHLAGKQRHFEGRFKSSGMLQCCNGETVPHILKIALPSKLWELFIQLYKGNTPEHMNHQQHYCENLKSCNKVSVHLSKLPKWKEQQCSQDWKNSRQTHQIQPSSLPISSPWGWTHNKGNHGRTDSLTELFKRAQRAKRHHNKQHSLTKLLLKAIIEISPLLIQHLAYLRVTCTQQDLERNPTQITISSK